MLVEEMLKLAVPFSVIGIGELIRMGNKTYLPEDKKTNYNKKQNYYKKNKKERD